MELTIKINLDNDAYQVDMVQELKDNFADLVTKINWDDENGIIRDSNGNKVGFWNIEGEE